MTSTNFPKSTRIQFLLFFTILIFLANGCVFAQDKSSYKTMNDKENQSEIYIIDEASGKAHMNSFSQGMKKMDEEFKPMDEGKILFADGQYEEAKNKYLLSLKIHQKNKSLEWLPRLRLAEAYEKLNDKANAIEQLNWLIKDCQSDITRKELISRRDKLDSSKL